jgi:uncharacterized membrane protein
MEVVLFLILFVIFVLMIVTLGSLSDIKSKVEKLDTKVSSQLKTLREELVLPCKEDETPKKAISVPESGTPFVAPLLEAKPVLSPIKTPDAPFCPKPSVLQQSPVDSAAARIMRKIWNWIVVGEEFRNPGVPAEFAIATAWLVRVGVIVVVMAVGFGLQLSIKRGILGPAGRVACSLIFGTLFVGLGIRCMTKQLQMLGQGFIGGGLAMFYFAFYAASMMFNLMPAQFAFVSMALVTAAAVVIAVRLPMEYGGKCV